MRLEVKILEACAPGSRARAAFRRIAPVIAWIGIWQAASLAIRNDLLLPGPSLVLASLGRLALDPSFWQAVANSTSRIMAGVAAGYACAAALAAAAGASGMVRALAEPPLTAIKGTPIACAVVLLLIWFGAEHVSSVAVFLLVLPGIYFPILAALDAPDSSLSELFASYGAGRATRLLACTWPRVLEHLAGASRSVLGMSWKAGVAAELIGTPLATIGERIYQAKVLLETDELLAWTIAVVALSWAVERILVALLDASWPATAALAAAHASGPRDGGGRGRASAAPSSATCVCGPSGAGKTTWLRREAGLGSKGPVAWVFQETRLVEELSALQNATLLAGARAGDAAREILVDLGLGDRMERAVSTLSGGERRRVELVRALAAPCGLLALDEPFTGLDAEARGLAIECIARHLDGRELLVAVHDPSDVRLLDPRIIELGRS